MATAPSFGFAHAYQLPPDCVFVREVLGGDAYPWTGEGGKLLTDLSAPLSVTYTRAETNHALFDALFAEALAVVSIKAG